jgi:hypothetical protein
MLHYFGPNPSNFEGSISVIWTFEMMGQVRLCPSGWGEASVRLMPKRWAETVEKRRSGKLVHEYLRRLCNFFILVILKNFFHK